MGNKKIMELLDKLNKALEGLDASDEKSRKKLSQLIQKIDRKLGGAEKAGKDSPLADELKDAAIHFEAKHPMIAETLEQIKLSLYSIGL